MKDYKRLTDSAIASMISRTLDNRLEAKTYIRLAELEDKIESGELCDREEVRKETAREILDKVYKAVESARLNSEYQDKKRKWVIDEYEFMSEFTLGDLHNLYKEYGIDMFGTEQVGNSDKLEEKQ